jgi:hypothetical protein
LQPLRSEAVLSNIDPRADIAWVTHAFAESARLLSEGKIDGYLKAKRARP